VAFYRIMAVGRQESPRCRPGSHVIDQLVGAPVGNDAEIADLQLAKGYGDRRVLVLDDCPFRRPVVLNLGEDIQHDRIDVIVNDAILITPECEDSAGFQHPIRFNKERVDVEPVQCLGDRDQIDGTVRQSGVLGSRDAIVDVTGFVRRVDLLFAGVRRDNLGEMRNQRSSRLPVSRRAVPRQIVRPAKVRKTCE